MTKKQNDTTRKTTEETENTQVEEVEKVEKVEDQLGQLENQLKRALADYQNLEKRMVEERREWVQQANKGLLMRILPAIDMLELALKHVQDKGVQMAVRHVLQALKEEGVEKIQTVGQDFDPHRMECVQTVAGRSGKVVEELRSGYTLYDKVLRPAQVTVGKGE